MVVRPCVGVHKKLSLIKFIFISPTVLSISLACIGRLVGFYGISTFVGYLMPNPLYTYILNIYDLIVDYLMPNPLYMYILNIYDLV